MWNVIIHAPEEAIPFDTEPLQESQHRIDIYLTQHVRLQKVKEEEVVATFSLGVVDEGIWDCHLAFAFPEIDGGAITGEIEEVPWPCQPPHFHGPEAGLQP